MTRMTDQKKIAQGVLATVIAVGFFTCLITLFVMKTDGNAGLQGAQLLLIGTLQTTFGVVVGYYFGSTSGSDKKTDLLANSTPTPTTPVIVTTTSEEGRTNTSFVTPNLQEIEELQARLSALQTKGLKTQEEVDDETYLLRRIEELRNQTPN